MLFPAPSSTTTEHDALTSTIISRELHQTAQPLTVLQGLLELALLTSRTTEDYRSVIARAMEQSRRISGCFDLVRKLFHLQQPALDLSTFSVSDMAATVVESVRDTYAVAGVGCKFYPLGYGHDSGIDMVTASEGRVSAALALILSNLPRWAGNGGTVEAAVEIDFQQVLVRIHARREDSAEAGASAVDVDSMSAPLSLAGTMVSSAGGRLVKGEPEFSVLISLPKAQQTPEMYETQRIECVHV